MITDRISQLESFLSEDKDDCFTLFALAMEYNKTGNSDKALFYFEYLLKNHPDYTGTYYHAGKLYDFLGERLKATETFEKGILQARKAKDQHTANELQQALDDLSL